MLQLNRTKKFAVCGLQDKFEDAQFKSDLKKGRDKYAFLCGAGVSMSISNEMKTWGGFIDQFAEKAEKFAGLGQDWLDKYHSIKKLDNQTDVDYMEGKIAFVEERLECWNTGSQQLEKHHLIAQMILRNPTLDHRERGVILHEVGILILTTNYDTVVEDCVPRDRISISHTDAMKYLTVDENQSLGSGPFLQNPSKHFVVHVHGRFFDIGDDHGFCFTTEEYVNDLMCKKFLEFMLQVVKVKSLIFIGARGTLDDQHFKMLWEEQRHNQLFPHYILHHSGERDGIIELVTRIKTDYNVQVVPVCYGENRDDLWNYLAECKADDI